MKTGYEDLIGKEIRIVKLKDEPQSTMEHYKNKTGTITSIETDPWGDVRFMGTWGSIAVYPESDEIEYITK